MLVASPEQLRHSTGVIHVSRECQPPVSDYYVMASCVSLGRLRVPSELIKTRSSSDPALRCQAHVKDVLDSCARARQQCADMLQSMTQVCVSESGATRLPRLRPAAWRLCTSKVVSAIQPRHLSFLNSGACVHLVPAAFGLLWYALMARECVDAWPVLYSACVCAMVTQACLLVSRMCVLQIVYAYPRRRITLALH